MLTRPTTRNTQDTNSSFDDQRMLKMTLGVEIDGVTIVAQNVGTYKDVTIAHKLTFLEHISVVSGKAVKLVATCLGLCNM